MTAPALTAAAEAMAEDELLRFRLVATPGHLLRRGNQLSYEIFTRMVGRAGPTRQQFAVLITVFQNPGARQSRLAAASGIDRVTLTEMLGRLVEKGWIVRERSPRDSRAHDISLTARGLALLRRVTPRVAEAQEKLLQNLPASERESFLRSLQALTLNGPTFDEEQAAE